jgi:hypothetical protein
VGQGVAEAQRERELSKQALEAQVGTLESRVREELDWKAKLRKHGPRYAVIGGVGAVAITGIIVLRKKFGKSKQADPELTVGSLEDIARELKQLRKDLDARKAESGPVWQKLAMRVATAAAAAGATLATRKVMERYAPEASSLDEPAAKEAGHAARAATV